MALDHALAEAMREGEAVLRLYGWRRPTVSFGRNEPARELYRDRSDGGAHVDFVRRPTGGRAVLHDGEVTYSVVGPATAFGGARAMYRLVNEALLEALRALGAPVELAGASAATPVDAGPCFARPAAGEVIAAGRKVVGSAQARIGRALLQHGSIRVRDEGGAATAVSVGATSLSELLGSVEVADVAAAVERAFRVRMSGTWTDDSYTVEERAAADRWVDDRYGRASWTWRR